MDQTFLTVAAYACLASGLALLLAFLWKWIISPPAGWIAALVLCMCGVLLLNHKWNEITMDVYGAQMRISELEQRLALAEKQNEAARHVVSLVDDNVDDKMAEHARLAANMLAELKAIGADADSEQLNLAADRILSAGDLAIVDRNALQQAIQQFDNSIRSVPADVSGELNFGGSRFRSGITKVDPQ